MEHYLEYKLWDVVQGRAQGSPLVTILKPNALFDIACETIHVLVSTCNMPCYLTVSRHCNRIHICLLSRGRRSAIEPLRHE